MGFHAEMDKQQALTIDQANMQCLDILATGLHILGHMSTNAHKPVLLYSINITSTASASATPRCHPPSAKHTGTIDYTPNFTHPCLAGLHS